MNPNNYSGEQRRKLLEMWDNAQQLLDYHSGLKFYGADCVTHAKANDKLRTKIDTLDTLLHGTALSPETRRKLEQGVGL